MDSVSQSGKAVAPQAFQPSFSEDLATSLRAALHTLAPGASVSVPLVVTTGNDGDTVLDSVSYAPFATIGARYPIDRSKALQFAVHYAAPALAVSGAPLCVAAAGSGTLGATTAAAGRRTVWIIAAVGLLLLVMAVIVVLLLLRGRRRRRATVAAAALLCLVLSGLAVLGSRPTPARADIGAAESVAGAVADCVKTFQLPGGDPAGILGQLSGSDVNVTVYQSVQSYDWESRADTSHMLIHWRPDDHGARYDDGVPQVPCDNLYHELWHAVEDKTAKGADPHECILADGTHTGIAIKEVSATRAENKLRAIEPGHGVRTLYGDHKLPTGECRPSRPGDPVCLDEVGCVSRNDGARSTTDPHVRTLDDRHFDFQGAGEFVAVRDTAAPDPTTALQIQVRQQPWPGSRLVAVNTAVVANVNGDRIQLGLAGGGLVLLIDGAVHDLSTVDLPKGGHLAVASANAVATATITWPDGSYAVVNPYGTTTLTLQVVLAKSYAGHVTGLFGNDDGNPGNDFPAADVTYDALYPAYADSLRITDATSLFQYDKGKSTASYTDRTFPDRPPAIPPANEDWARQQCQAYGVTDAQALADCVLDLSRTGSADLLTADADAEISDRGFVPGGSPAFLSITAPGGVSTVDFPGTAGQHLYVDVPATTLPDSCDTLRLRNPDGSTLASGCLINGRGGIDTVTLPVSGTYTIVVDPPGNATGDITLQLYFASDTAGALSVDGDPVTLSVNTPGGTAEASFTGTAGQIVFGTVTAGTIPDQCGPLELLDASGATLGSACVLHGVGFIDRVVLPATGTYKLRLDPGGTGTGSVTVALTSATDQSGSIAVGGPPVTMRIGQPGAVAKFSFTAKAGDIVYLDASAATIPDACGVLSVLDSTGGTVGTGCVLSHVGSVDRTVLKVAGTYSIELDLSGAGTGAVTVALHAVTDDTGTIDVGGAPVTAHVSTAGGIADYHFTGTAGQHVTVDASDSTLPDACGLILVRDGSGATLNTGCVLDKTGSFTVTLPAAGTYDVVVDPNGAATGQLTLRVH